MEHFYSFNRAIHRTGFLFGAVLFVCSLVVSGCTDSFFTEEVATEHENAFQQTDSKLRHAHLFDRALKVNAVAKTGSASEDLNLVIGLADHVLDKQRVLQRYKVMNRYKVLHRYEFNEVFNGWAWSIEDSLQLGEYNDFLDQLENDPDILWYEPDFSVTSPDSDANDGSAGQMVPWSVAAIGGMQSWTQSGDGQGTVDIDIYVLDTGVSNDDLDVTEQVDVRDNFDDPTDYDGHGTHVAGIAAAVDDADGLVGVAPGARVHNLKVLNDDGQTDVSVVIAAVEQILLSKQASPSTPMVVNMSIGEDIGSADYTALDEAIRTATQAGVVFVVAAGNQSKDASMVTPAHVAEVITVGSYNAVGVFSPFSNYGSMVDLLAPGEYVVSLRPGSGVPVEMSGTSMSAAHVTGAAALYLAQHPQATPSEVRDGLLANAKDFVVNAPASTSTLSVWVGEEAGATGVTYRDEFNAISFSGNDGTASWLGSWQEIGESDGVSGGKVRVVTDYSCADETCLRIRGGKKNRGTSRAADLSGAVSATISIDSRRDNFTGANLKLEISTDGGATWTVLKSFADGDDEHPRSWSMDISAHLSADTRIRFHSYTNGSGMLHIDNVEIETNALMSGGEMEYENNVFDVFNALTYNGNDGTLAWSNDWQEIGEADGPRAGPVRVSDKRYCASGNCLRVNTNDAGHGALREVDLSGAASARLSFDWVRLNAIDTSMEVEVSRNGGMSWTKLMTIPVGSGDHPANERFDISAFLSSNTQIRFVKTNVGGGRFFIDNVLIEF